MTSRGSRATVRHLLAGVTVLLACVRFGAACTREVLEVAVCDTGVELASSECSELASSVLVSCGAFGNLNKIEKCIEKVYNDYTYVSPAMVAVFSDRDGTAVSGDSADPYSDVIMFRITVGSKCAPVSVLLVTKTDKDQSDDIRPLPDANETQSDDIIRLDLVIEEENPEIEAVFERAVSYWNAVLRGTPLPMWYLETEWDVSDICFADNAIISAGIQEGLKIFARIQSIDGEGSILGYAAPCLVLVDDLMPVAGTMVLDQVDVEGLLEAGALERTILHEMGHILGIGTLWDGFLVRKQSPNPSFTGSKARKAWKALGGPGRYVPVESQGGQGTALGHWDEAVFEGELMTGWLSGHVRLSEVTIGALADLGYTVNTQFAESYELPAVASKLKRRNAASADGVFHLGNDVAPVDFAQGINKTGHVVTLVELEQHAARAATESHP